MKIKPIRTEADYEAALKAIEKLMDAEPDTSEGDDLDVLVTLTEAYEEKHHPIAGPDPIAAIQNRMDSMGLTRRDLEPLIGGRGRISEVLSRKRALSIEMIRQLRSCK